MSVTTQRLLVVKFGRCYRMNTVVKIVEKFCISVDEVSNGHPVQVLSIGNPFGIAKTANSDFFPSPVAVLTIWHPSEEGVEAPLSIQQVKEMLQGYARGFVRKSSESDSLLFFDAPDQTIEIGHPDPFIMQYIAPSRIEYVRNFERRRQEEATVAR